jgi:hypothetical protein
MIFLSNFQATFASGFPDRSIPATETTGRIVEKFEHLRKIPFHLSCSLVRLHWKGK